MRSSFDKVKVPKENIVGELGKGYKIAIETLNEGRIGIASQMLGLAEGALDGAWKYSKERSQFGKNLNRFQGIQFQLAEMAIKIESAKIMVYNAARLKDAGLPFAKEAAMAKYHAGMVAEEVASRALEIYGGYGFIKEFPAEKFYRDAKIGKLYEGTSNMQLQTIFKMIDSESSRTPIGVLCTPGSVMKLLFLILISSPLHLRVKQDLEKNLTKNLKIASVIKTKQIMTNYGNSISLIAKYLQNLQNKKTPF